MGFIQRPYPEFAWSESRARRFRECRRKHYLAIYRSHNGWTPGAPGDRRLAWVLGKAVPGWQAALGTAVHRQVVQCALACANTGRLPAREAVRYAAAHELNYLYRCTRSRVADFLRTPTKWPVLVDALYDSGLSNSTFEPLRKKLDDAISSLFAFEDLWEVVRSAGVNGVIGPDRWSSFTLAPDNLTVFAAPDLVLHFGPERPAEVWEFKTGKIGDVIDTVLLYARTARDSLAIPPFRSEAARYVGRVICLQPSVSAEQREPFAISDHDFVMTEGRIREGVSEMRALLVDPANNVPHDIEAFPRTERRWMCPMCQYRGICEPETFPLRLQSTGRSPGGKPL